MISNGGYTGTVIFYVYVPFDVLPTIGFRNDFAIEGGSGVRHLIASLCLPSFSYFGMISYEYLAES